MNGLRKSVLGGETAISRLDILRDLFDQPGLEQKLAGTIVFAPAPAWDDLRLCHRSDRQREGVAALASRGMLISQTVEEDEGQGCRIGVDIVQQIELDTPALALALRAGPPFNFTVFAILPDVEHGFHDL